MKRKKTPSKIVPIFPGQDRFPSGIPPIAPISRDFGKHLTCFYQTYCSPVNETPVVCIYSRIHRASGKSLRDPLTVPPTWSISLARGGLMIRQDNLPAVRGQDADNRGAYE